MPEAVNLTGVISDRLSRLRKHLGERLGIKLTLPELANLSGMKDDTIQRLESGLRGNTQSLVTLLNFYRGHGYSLDWILATDNSHLPMIVAENDQLVRLNQEIVEFARLMEQGSVKLNAHLREMGYRSDADRFPESTGTTDEPLGIL